VFYQVFLFFYTRKGGGQVRRRKGEGRRKDGKAALVIPNPASVRVRNLIDPRARAGSLIRKRPGFGMTAKT